MLDTTQDGKKVWDSTIILHSAFCVVMELAIDARYLGQASNLSEATEETTSPDQVKGLSEIKKGDIKGLSLFLALLL